MYCNSPLHLINLMSNVLEGVWLGLWPLVVSQLPLLQRLHQGYQPETNMSALRYTSQVQRSHLVRRVGNKIGSMLGTDRADWYSFMVTKATVRSL